MNNDFLRTVSAFVKANKCAVTLTLVGIVLAVLFICIGFWSTILILVLACAGCAGGIVLDKKLRQPKPGDSPFGKYDD